MGYITGRLYTRLAVAFACWNTVVLARGQEFQRAIVTAIRVYCKEIRPLYRLLIEVVIK